MPPRSHSLPERSSHPQHSLRPPLHRPADTEVSAALEVQRLSADEPIAALAADPDKFFNRTRTVGAGGGVPASK